MQFACPVTKKAHRGKLHEGGIVCRDCDQVMAKPEEAGYFMQRDPDFETEGLPHP